MIKKAVDLAGAIQVFRVYQDWQDKTPRLVRANAKPTKNGYRLLDNRDAWRFRTLVEAADVSLTPESAAELYVRECRDARDRAIKETASSEAALVAALKFQEELL